MTTDPREVKNLADDPHYAEVVKRLSTLLDEHVKGAVEVPPECLVRAGKAAKGWKAGSL